MAILGLRPFCRIEGGLLVCKRLNFQRIYLEQGYYSIFREKYGKYCEIIMYLEGDIQMMSMQ